MKKLTLALSAIAAAFSASAQADVSVSGAASAAYLSSAASSQNTSIITSGSVAFALSTTTASGMGISAGMGISQDPDADGQTVTSSVPSGVTGGQAVTFTTGGATIVVGDMELNDTPGSVGGVVGGVLADNSALNSNVASGFKDDDGLGVSLATSVGAASLSVGYIVNDNKNNNGVINSTTAAEQAMTAASLTVPMGMYTISVGVADHDSGESASGASVAASLGGGTLTVGYSTQTLKNSSHATAANADLSTNGDTTVMGATYAMSLDADTSIKVGYQSQKDADSDSTTRMDASLSRSLGGGASVYLDLRNLSGDAAVKDTAIAFGTSVAF
jgi:hypothetical protein